MYNYQLTIECEVNLSKHSIGTVKATYSKKISEINLNIVYAVADEIIQDALNDADTKVLRISLQESLKA
jgi:hypothetical protein